MDASPFVDMRMNPSGRHKPDVPKPVPAPHQGIPCTLQTLLESLGLPNDQARIDWLVGQLNRTTEMLNAKDATEAQVVARFEVQYAEKFEEMKANLNHVREAYKAGSARYDVLRNHVVSVRSLNLAAKGEHLDRLIDGMIARTTQKDIVYDTPGAVSGEIRRLRDPGESSHSQQQPG